MAYVQSILTNKPSYIDGGSYAALFDRRPLADIISAGVVGANDCLVTWVTGLTLQIAAGAAYISGQNIAYQGNYHCYIPSAVQLACTAANGSNPRIDTVILRALDNASDSSAFTEGRIEIVPGTPTAGADLTNLNGKANLTTLTDASKSVLILAYILVPTGAVNLDATKVKDVRVRSLVGGGNAVLNPALNIATSVAGLGTPSDGKFGRIRAGATPYDFVDVIYDATYTKWVSPSFSLTRVRPGPNVYVDSFNVGAYTDLNNSLGLSAIGFHPFKVFTDAGLTLQVCLRALARHGVADGTSGNLQVAYRHWNDGDSDGATGAWGTAWTGIGATEITWTPSTNMIFKIGSWQPVSPATPKSLIEFAWQGKKVGGTGQFNVNALDILGRWVA